jgi:DNA-binding MarR family transcriptional regulator
MEMRITELNDFVILLRLDELAKRRNVKLTFAHKKLYIAFVRFCEEKGQYDEDKRQYYLSLTVNEMAHEFAAGHTTVTGALKALSDCGAINRAKSSALKSSDADGSNGRNQAFLTYINVDFLAGDKND